MLGIQTEEMRMPTIVANKYKVAPSPSNVYIGRGSLWGNPFIIGKDGSREDVIRKYHEYFVNNAALTRRVGELKGKTLVCFCAPKACHGDVLKHYADLT